MELFDTEGLDALYFFSIPEDEVETHKKNLDKYLIYYADFAEGEIQEMYKNFKMFMIDLLGDKNTDYLNKFSNQIMEQIIPEIYEDEEENNTKDE